MFKKLFAIAALVSIGSGALYAQADGTTATHNITVTIPEVALVDLEGGTAVTLAFPTPTEAGAAFDVSTVTNNSLWLNYSSIVASAGETSRIVKVKLGSKQTNGLDVRLLAAAQAGGTGTTGTPSAMLTLTTSDQDLISAIGSCYTGNGTSSGHQLTYSLNINDVAALKHDLDDNAVVVTFTITDN